MLHYKSIHGKSIQNQINGNKRISIRILITIRLYYP